MKKSILAFLLLIGFVSLSANIPTVISGKVVNNPGHPVILLVYVFDTVRMQEVEYRYQTRIADDHTFSFLTDKISRPHTFCRIGFDNEGMKLRISPGDSLYTEFAAGAMDTTITFSGPGAGINRYLKNLEQLERKTVLQWTRSDGLPGPKTLDLLERASAGLNYAFLRSLNDTALAFYLTGNRDRKLEELYRVDSVSILGPGFLAMEQERIHCDFFNRLMSRDIQAVLGDSLCNRLRDETLRHITMNNAGLLMDLREYRDFIWNYIRYRQEAPKDRKLTIQDDLDQAATELSGQVLSWFNQVRILRAIDRARYMSDKALLIRYFTDHSNDPRIKSFLLSYQPEITGENFRATSGNFLSTQAFLLGVLILVAVLALVMLTVARISRIRLPGNPYQVLFWGIILLMACMAGAYLLMDFYPGNRKVSVFRVLTVITFLMVHTVYLLPVWFRKRQYPWYILMLAGLTLAYALVMTKLGEMQSIGHGRFGWIQNHGPLFILISWLTGILASFTLHFLSLSIRTGRRFMDILKEYRINPEVLFGVLIVSLLFLNILLKNTNPREGRNEILIFLTGVAIFYLHVLWQIPVYQKTSGIARYLIKSLVLVLPTILIFYAADRYLYFRSLTDLGIRLSFLDLIKMPDPYLIKTALTIQLVMVPAWLYTWVKIQLRQKSTGFQLFRNKEAELNQLRSQVNPHFLFNSLNTLYAFALREESTKTAEYIAKLANLMRYLIDDMEKERIPVQKEINYIRDYVNLQAIRSSVDHRIEITSTLSDEEPLMIAPMLMIPFVENAFKHGINPGSPSELKIAFQMQDGCFQFVIENSTDPNLGTFSREKGFGIGIPNVRQRLEYLYPGRHTLSIASTGDRFIVILTLVPDQVEEQTRKSS